MKYIMLSPTGTFFFIEPFGFYWMFEGLPGLGYWTSKTKMIKFYEEAFGFQYLGKL